MPLEVKEPKPSQNNSGATLCNYLHFCVEPCTALDNKIVRIKLTNFPVNVDVDSSTVPMNVMPGT